ncbi:MAG: flagellar basal body-associated FliL family protein [Gammaproteobacteria bacterium]|jgi:flagellar FliL protein
MAETEAAAESTGGGTKKLIIIAAVVALALGSGGAAFMLGGSDDAAVAGEEPAPAHAAEPIYIPLGPAFVVNFQDKHRKTKFLKAELNVVTYNEDVPEAVLKHMPVIRNNLILLFSRQLYEDLLPHEGKEVLRAEALGQVQAVIEKQVTGSGVEDLFFTSFVMQ